VFIKLGVWQGLVTPLHVRQSVLKCSTSPCTYTDPFKCPEQLNMNMRVGGGVAVGQGCCRQLQENEQGINRYSNSTEDKMGAQALLNQWRIMFLST